MRMFPACALSLLLASLPLPAFAQSVAEVQASLSVILRDVEGNLVEKEGIEMNFKVWQANQTALKARLDEYNGRVAEENAYCQGTYEEEEYQRRKAQCESAFAQLDTLKAQLEPEIKNNEDQFLELQTRETARAQAMAAIGQRLDAALQQLTLACATLSNEEFASTCHLPPAPGPRSADMVAQLNATIAGKTR